MSLLTDYTIQTVIMGAVLLGISSGVLGSFAVLRQQSLLGDTLAHAALPGVCLGFLLTGKNLGGLLAGALLTGTLAALVVMVLLRRSRLKTDAALGSVLSVFFAAGVVMLTFIQRQGNASQGGLDAFLFGQAAAILRSDLWVMAAITLLALTLVALFWKELKLITFDPLFAGSLGLPVRLLEGLLTAMIAFAVVIGLQMVGVVLMAAMVIAPAVAARQWTHRLETMVVLSAVFGATGGTIGALISATQRGLATGPLIILAMSALVLVSLLFSPERGLLWDLWQRARYRRSLKSKQVLTTLYELSLKHDNAAYPAEQGMVDTYYGVATDVILKRLAAQGLVRKAQHMPEERAHWTLTAAGRHEAEGILRNLGRAQDNADIPLQVVS